MFILESRQTHAQYACRPPYRTFTYIARLHTRWEMEVTLWYLSVHYNKFRPRIFISYHRTCYGANPPELNSALHT